MSDDASNGATMSQDITGMEVAELPQIPAKPRLPHAFTRENTAEMARKAVVVREARKAREREALEEARVNPKKATLEREQDRAELVAEQIVRTRKELNKTLEPRERAQLLCALDKLLDRERIQWREPLPGSRRPGREPASKAPSTYEPSE